MVIIYLEYYLILRFYPKLIALFLNYFLTKYIDEKLKN